MPRLTLALLLITISPSLHSPRPITEQIPLGSTPTVVVVLLAGFDGQDALVSPAPLELSTSASSADFPTPPEEEAKEEEEEDPKVLGINLREPN